MFFRPTSLKKKTGLYIISLETGKTALCDFRWYTLYCCYRNLLHSFTNQKIEREREREEASERERKRFIVSPIHENL